MYGLVPSALSISKDILMCDMATVRKEFLVCVAQSTEHSWFPKMLVHPVLLEMLVSFLSFRLVEFCTKRLWY